MFQHISNFTTLCLRSTNPVVLTAGRHRRSKWQCTTFGPTITMGPLTVGPGAASCNISPRRLWPPIQASSLMAGGGDAGFNVTYNVVTHGNWDWNFDLRVVNDAARSTVQSPAAYSD